MTQFIEINELYSMQLSIRHNIKKSYFECPFIKQHFTWFVFSLNLHCYVVVTQKSIREWYYFFTARENATVCGRYTE